MPSQHTNLDYGKMSSMSSYDIIVDRIVQASSRLMPGTQASTAEEVTYMQSGGEAPAAVSVPGEASATSPGRGMPALHAIDISAVLSKLAQQHPTGLDWRTSIADFLKLLAVEFDREARAALATQLGVRLGPEGTAEQDSALQRALIARLAQDGGKWPEA